MHPVQQWMILIFVLQMQDHNEKECPTAELKCPFSVVGCQFEVQQAFIYFFLRNIICLLFFYLKIHLKVGVKYKRTLTPLQGIKMISAQHSSNNGKNWQKLSYQKILLSW